MLDTSEHKRTICDNCSMVLPGYDIIEKASKQTKMGVKYIDTGSNFVCPNCVMELLQYQRKLRREKELKAVYNCTMKLYNYVWSEDFVVIDPKNLVDTMLGLNVYSDDELYCQLTKPICYKHMTVKKIYETYEEKANSVTGITLPSDANIHTMQPYICNDIRS